MASLRSLTASGRLLLLALFGCAMLLRIAVPAGWMPDASAGSAAWLMPCDGMARAMPMHGGKHHMPSDRERPDQPCAFAGLALAAALPDPFVVVVALVREEAAPMLGRPLVSIGRGLAAPPPPQTGPPRLA